MYRFAHFMTLGSLSKMVLSGASPSVLPVVLDLPSFTAGLIHCVHGPGGHLQLTWQDVVNVVSSYGMTVQSSCSATSTHALARQDVSLRLTHGAQGNPFEQQ